MKAEDVEYAVLRAQADQLLAFARELGLLDLDRDLFFQLCQRLKEDEL